MLKDNTERDTRRGFWAEQYQKTKQSKYRNKLWYETSAIGYKLVNMYIPRGSWFESRYDDYVTAMKEGFENALVTYDGVRSCWNTHLVWCIRSKLSHRKDAFNTAHARQQAQINTILLNDLAKDLDYLKIFTDPTDYAEKVIWDYDKSRFLKTLSDSDQKIVRLILERESLTSVAEQVVHNRNTNDMRKRCLRIGQQYKEYMGG